MKIQVRVTLICVLQKRVGVIDSLNYLLISLSWVKSQSTHQSSLGKVME